MLERLEQIEKRYNEIKEKLSESDVIQDIKRTTELSKELSSLEDIVNSYSEYKTILSGIKEAHEMENDKDLGEFAKEEILRLGPLKEEKEKELEIMLIPKDPNDDKNVIVEIRGAAGGDEANIFAGDLFDMYTRYAESKGWSYEVTNEVIGTINNNERVESITNKVINRDGYFTFDNLKYNYLVTNRCYWINKEYDNNNAFAFTKADEKISKIYKSSKNETCNIIPVIIAPKANIYE